MLSTLGSPFGSPCGRRQRGLSLVEMMVGLAVGLLVVAGATMVVTTQLGDNRRLLLETQLQQDLRAAADIITRDLRRAGSWTDTARLSLWTPTAAPQANPYSAATPASGVTSSEVSYGYYRNAGSPTLYGFKLQDAVLKSLLGGTPQELTDPRIMEVLTFDVTARDGPAQQTPCPKLCPGLPLPATACWPAVTVRDFVVAITARSVADPAVQRSLSTSVRVRNDVVTGACPA
jgi:prepilin-type N-terminal cleavage/methylation domain-containing protein